MTEHDDAEVTPQTRHGVADADGKAIGSPSIASGNLVQAPINVEPNVTGNTANVIGVGNAAFDDDSPDR